MHFLGHFPQKHVMPGVLILEALAQTGAVAILTEEENKGKIVLFGGEPFIKFEHIKNIVEYVEANYSSRNITVFISTNGTLLTEEIKNWIRRYKHLLVCGLSYDGTPEMQDINRSNSSSLIDLDFFATTYPDQEVKMTISK